MVSSIKTQLKISICNVKIIRFKDMQKMMRSMICLNRDFSSPSDVLDVNDEKTKNTRKKISIFRKFQ